MKAFFERYSYPCVRLMLNQVAISMFGFALAMTAGKAESDALLLWSSIGSVIFYLALTYGSAWKTGSEDRLSIRYGKIPFKPLRGLVLSLIANLFNILMAVLITVGQLADVGGLESIARLIALLTQGMYQGILATVQLGGVTLNSICWSYFIITVPAMLVSLVAYIAGAKDFHITKMGIPELPESDRPTKQEMRQQREQEKQSNK